MTVRVTDSAGLTQTGHVRRSNEDTLLLRDPLFMVADGMGGALAGELASRMCAEAFAEVDLIRSHGEDALRQAIGAANRRIFERAQADAEASGMGTTVAAALFGDDGRIAFANVGDSRAYLFRDGVLQRLSEDHSLVAELVASGQISEQEAERHPQRSVITRVLGAEQSVQVDSFVIEVKEGDVFLLCTDGLNTMVSEERIAELLASDRPAAEIARELVRAALAGGGEDNVTVVVFRTGVAPAEEQTAGHTPRRILTSDPDLEDEEGGRRISRRKLALILAIVLAVAAATTVGAVAALRWSHFVGANETTQRIAVYQGVPIELVGGIKLFHAVYESPVGYASLDPQTRRELFDHELRSYDDARDEVRRIEAASP